MVSRAGGGIEIAGLQQAVGQRGPDGGRGNIRAGQFLQPVHGFAKATLGPRDCAQTFRSGGQSRCCRQCCFEMLSCFGMAGDLQVQIAQIGVCLRMAWGDSQRPLQQLRGFGGLLQLFVHDGQIDHRIGVRRVVGERGFEMFARSRQIIAGESQYAEVE